MFGKTNMSEQAKGIRISGTITDKDKNPLPGVNVRVLEQTGTGVITDMDGHFYLDVPGKNSVIEISYIGFKTQQIKVGSKINFDVILEEDIEALDEVVVTGYGSQKKMSVIGSIETLQPKKLQVGATRSLSNNLAGQIAGVIAVQRSGEPGYDSSNFWIRGIASFSGGQSPLVLVDGIERDLNNIDPAEIESFSVLKDASASAMYGVRGANGVIVINTKRGKVGAPSVNLRVEHSIAEPTKLPDFIGAADHMTLINEITENKSRLPFSQEQIDRTRYGYDRDLYPDVNYIEAPDMTPDGKPLLLGTGQDFMACIIGAAMCGVGLGITFNYNGSTGGTDIIAAVVNKYRDVSLGRMIMICDVFIIGSCYFIFHDWRRVIFGFVTLFIIGVVLDWIINSARQSVQFFIFSKKYDEIADRIIKDADRGVTVLDGTGWYSKNNVKVLVVLAKKRQSLDIFRLVKRIDPNAFISQSSVIGVYGEGFDKLKVK